MSDDEHPLRTYRREHSLTLERLAEKVGTSFATISRIEGRRLQPSHKLLIRLSEATGISIDELVRASIVVASCTQEPEAA